MKLKEVLDVLCGDYMIYCVDVDQLIYTTTGYDYKETAYYLDKEKYDNYTVSYMRVEEGMLSNHELYIEIEEDK